MSEEKGRPTVGWTEQAINEYTTKIPDGVEIEVGAGEPPAGIRASKCTDSRWAWCGQCTWESSVC